ncbi:hypothetical protein INR49_002743 [Caranx melampygus]|nr:hypothetical protein INR49_002743 [Caranx melampygus]
MPGSSGGLVGLFLTGERMVAVPKLHDLLSPADRSGRSQEEAALHHRGQKKFTGWFKEDKDRKLPSTTEARGSLLVGSKKTKTLKTEISCPPPLRPEEVCWLVQRRQKTLKTEMLVFFCFFLLINGCLASMCLLFVLSGLW